MQWMHISSKVLTPCATVQNEEEMKIMRWCTWSWQSYKRAIFLFSDALAWVKKIAAFTPFRLFQLNWIELSLLLTILSSCFCARLLPLFFSINAHLLFLLLFVFPYSSCKQWMQLKKVFLFILWYILHFILVFSIAK